MYIIRTVFIHTVVSDHFLHCVGLEVQALLLNVATQERNVLQSWQGHTILFPENVSPGHVVTSLKETIYPIHTESNYWVNLVIWFKWVKNFIDIWKFVLACSTCKYENHYCLLHFNSFSFTPFLHVCKVMIMHYKYSTFNLKLEWG